MRIVFLFLCAICLTWASDHLSHTNTVLSTFKDTLQITLPSKIKFTSQKSSQTITLTIDQKWLDKPFQKSLNYPFQSIQITPKGDQTLIIIKAQNDFFYEENKDSQNLRLIFKINSSGFWWQYGIVIAILLALLVFLFYLKKRQIPSAHRSFQMTQMPLSKNCKIIILENQEKTFTIFSDGRSCVLLDSKDFQPKED